MIEVIAQLWLWIGAAVAIYAGVDTYKEWMAHANKG
jgi:hypothetical protein